MSDFWSYWRLPLILVVSTGCIITIMGVCFAIFGPHYPPAPFNAKTEFVKNCEFNSGIPDVHTNNWTCTGWRH